MYRGGFDSIGFSELAKNVLTVGSVADAVTVAKGMVIVVTEAGRVLVFAPDGTLRQEIALD